MKKLFLLSSFFFLLSSFAYTSEDASNANFIADQGIITKQTIDSKYALDNKILRQEVIAMALKIKGIAIPTNTSCKKYFADATKKDWVCRAVELAADNGIITRSNKYANPGKYVTLAESLTMLMKAAGMQYSEYYSPSEIVHISQNIDVLGWQYNLSQGASHYDINRGTMTLSNLNNFATRKEVFGLIYRILNTQYGVCGVANQKTHSKRPSSQLCQHGTPSDVVSEMGMWVWKCTTTGMEPTQCSAKNTNEYYWDEEDWSTCWQGNQEKSITCRDSTNFSVESSFCENIQKPETARQCTMCVDGKIINGTQECQKYIPKELGGWGACIDNVQTQSVQCIEKDTGLTVREDFCPTLITTRACGTLVCEQEIDGKKFRLEPCSIDTTMQAGTEKHFQIAIFSDVESFSFGMLDEIGLPRTGIVGGSMGAQSSGKTHDLYFNEDLKKGHYSGYLPIRVGLNNVNFMKTLHFKVELEVQ